ncbi:polysaccharide export protein [Pelagimonas sp. KU-00592-HH]
MRVLPLALSLLVSACESGLLDTSVMRNDGVVFRKTVTSNPGVPGRDAGCRASTKSPETLSQSIPEQSYRVGPGDTLRFNIFGEEGMRDISARVDGGGYVQLPIVETVLVRGKTTRQIQRTVKEAYTAHFVNPWVTVELDDAESHPIYFLGEFKQSGVQYLEHPRTLLEALAMGGGLTPDAYLPGARLIRNDVMCIVDLQALLKQGRFDHNVYVASGDVIFAPRKEDMQVYMLGAVGKPRAVPFGADGRTLLEALSMAEGPDEANALLTDVRIVRSYSTTEGELLIVDVDAMLTGNALDYPLMPGDVVYVPRSALGNWNEAIAAILPSLELIGGIISPIVLIENL